jgi:NAD(P)H-dependent flavin oxidoreductase YrpB (nitropropane dioxygenase family)
MRTAFTDLLGVRHPIAGFNRSPAVGSPTRTGKPARQLRSAWHDEWERPGSPPPPPQPMLVSEAWQRIDAAADAGHEGALKLESFFVGQVVGSFSRLRLAAEITRQIIGDCEVRLAELAALLPAGAPAAP